MEEAREPFSHQPVQGRNGRCYDGQVALYCRVYKRDVVGWVGTRVRRGVV